VRTCSVFFYYGANLVAALLSFANPVMAETGGSKPDTTLADFTALTTAIEALRTQPADTVAENGGQMEATLLVSRAIAAAGFEVARRISSANNQKFIILGNNDTISTDIYVSFLAEYQGVCFGLTQTIDCGEKPATTVTVTDSNLAFVTPIPVIATLLPFLSSLLRSETEISSISSGILDDRLLTYAVAQALQGQGSVLTPSLITGYDATNPIYKMVAKLVETRNGIKMPDESEKAGIAAADVFLKGLFAADKEGKIKLLDVVRAELIASALGGGEDRGWLSKFYDNIENQDSTSDKALNDALPLRASWPLKIVRVHIEKSGGTMLKRKNLMVSLGATAIAVTGGVIVSYVVDDRSGKSSKVGYFVCQTGLMNLRTVHNLTAAYNSVCAQ
jgi:hypothetical protein